MFPFIRTHLSDTNPLIGFYKWRVAKIQAGELNQPLAAKTKLQEVSVGFSLREERTVFKEGCITDCPMHFVAFLIISIV